MNGMRSCIGEVQEGETGIDGVAVGHSTDVTALTGCTVVLLPRACAYGVDVTGGAASTRQVSAMVSGHSVSFADAVLVAGGSAYGLDAAGGVLAWLEGRGRGIRVGSMMVPSVPSAAVFDLFAGDGRVRPGPAMGREACTAARSEGVDEGRVGAGTGATVGKLLGLGRADWGGVGLHGVTLDGGIVVSALAVVNAFGSIFEGPGGPFVAGAVADDGVPVDPAELVMAGLMGVRLKAMTNTTIGVVVTNARMDPGACGRAAVMAGQAIVDCIIPCQTMVDGDIVFAVSAGDVEADPHQVGTAGRLALSRAIVRAVTAGVRPGPPRPGTEVKEPDES